MGDIVNLKRVRKRNEREQSAQQAAANRTRFGRTKSERAADERVKNHADRLLEQHKLQDKIDGGEAS